MKSKLLTSLLVAVLALGLMTTNTINANENDELQTEEMNDELETLDTDIEEVTEEELEADVEDSTSEELDANVASSEEPEKLVGETNVVTQRTARSVGYQAVKDNPSMLAYYMDEPLYDAIYNKYGTAIDTDTDTFISVAEANNWRGETNVSRKLDLTGLGVTGTVRGIDQFTNVLNITLTNNYLTGSIDAFSSMTSLQHLILANNYFTGNLDSLASMTSLKTLNMNGCSALSGVTLGFLSTMPNMADLQLYNCNIEGTLDPLVGLSSLRYIRLDANKLTGTIPSGLYSITTITYLNLAINNLTELSDGIEALTGLTTLGLHGNINLTGTLSASIASFATYTDTKLTAADTAVASSTIKYSLVTPQDGSAMIINGRSGIGSNKYLNIQRIGQIAYPELNIDINGDGIVDLNIDIDGDYLADFNHATAVFENANRTGQFIGYIPTDKMIDSSAYPLSVSDFTLNTDTWYLEGTAVIDNPSSTLLVGALELNKDNGDGTFSNIDVDNDGFPDINITNYIPQSSKNPSTDLDENGIPNSSGLITDVQNQGQSTDPTAPNYITPDGTVNNWDSDGDGIVDYNKDGNGDGVADFDVIQEDGTIKNPVQNTDPNGLNYDEDGDGYPDKNIDIDGKGISDIQDVLNKIDDLYNTDGTIKDTVTQSDIDEIQDIINNMMDGPEKTQAQDAIDVVQGHLDEKIAITNAKTAVESLFTTDGKLKDSVVQADIDNAQKLVDALADGTVKTQLNNKLKEAQKQLDEKMFTILEVFEDFTGLGTVYTKINAPVEKFRKVYVNGVELESDNYTVTSGSTVITLKESYLLSLSNNTTYNVEIEFESGAKVSTPLTIDVKPLISHPPVDGDDGVISHPSVDGGSTVSGNAVNAGDSTNLVALYAMIGSSLLAFVVIMKKRKEAK